MNEWINLFILFIFPRIIKTKIKVRDFDIGSLKYVMKQTNFFLGIWKCETHFVVQKTPCTVIQ